ncbi:MAG TPA: MFS transporter [Solirubrobacterales bacterium]|nr:MFS transporter [Solirubrobacterales bacterium]
MASGRFKWAVLIALCSGQFIMVLDSTVMNVSIQKVIEDLDTKVATMQLAIATYTLTTAALMLVGGKLGDIIGRRLAFRIGLVTFGAGALITSLAPNMGILILGWSILEAVGAALMIPAIISLLASNYEGADRVIAFGAIGGIAGAAAACGPIIGGWVATVGSWRDVFAGEAVIMVCLLGVSTIIRDAPLGRDRPRLDVVGGLLSAGGLALAVLGIVQSSTWGWIKPKESPAIGGTAIEPFGLSVVPFLIVAGLILVACFALWERRVATRGEDTLVDLAMLRLAQLRAGLGTMMVMFLCLGGIFFLMPLYLQIVLGKDPLQTGIDLLPMSLAVFFVAMGASRLSTRLAPRLLIQLGLLFVAAGAGLLILTIDSTFDSFPFAGSVLVVGIGLGLIASQVTNVNLASAGPDKTSETGALQGTAQNLGSALGTAVIGSLLLSVLTATFNHRVEGDTALPYGPRHEVAQKTSHGLAFVPAEEAAGALRQKGVPEPIVSQLEANYATSQVDALKIAIGGVAVIALLGLGVTRRLPSNPLRAPPIPA